jgi:hypothetical protein
MAERGERWNSYGVSVALGTELSTMSPLGLFLVFRAFTASKGIFNDTSSGTNRRMRDKAGRHYSTPAKVDVLKGTMCLL